MTGAMLVLGDLLSVIFGSRGLGLGVLGPRPPGLAGDSDLLLRDDGLGDSAREERLVASSFKALPSSLTGVPKLVSIESLMSEAPAGTSKSA